MLRTLSVRVLTLLLTSVSAMCSPVFAANPIELSEQIRSGALSGEVIAAAVRSALEIQQDKDAPWDPAWGDVIEAAHAAGHLDGEQFRQYARNSVDFTLVTRPRIWMTDAPPVSIELATRVGTERTLGLQIDVFDARIGDRRLTSARTINQYVITHREPDTPRFLRRMALHLENTPGVHPLGPSEVHLDIGVRVFENPNPAPDEILSEWRRTLVATIEVVDFEEDPIALIHDERVGRRLEESLRVMDIRTLPQPGGGCFLTMTIGCDHVPVAFAFDIFLQSGNNQWHIGEFAAHPNDHGLYTGRAQHLPSEVMTLGEVDVILLPSPDTARRDVDIVEIWGDEIVIPRVPLQALPMRR